MGVKLKMPKKSAKTPAKKSAKVKKSRPFKVADKYRTAAGRNRGLLTYVAEILAKNEKVPPNKRLPDWKIKALLVARYGPSPQFGDISNFRSAYNRGVYTKGKKPRQSRRYDNDGKPMKPHERYPRENTVGGGLSQKRAKIKTVKKAVAKARKAAKKLSKAVKAFKQGEKRAKTRLVIKKGKPKTKPAKKIPAKKTAAAVKVSSANKAKAKTVSATSKKKVVRTKGLAKAGAVVANAAGQEPVRNPVGGAEASEQRSADSAADRTSDVAA